MVLRGQQGIERTPPPASRTCDVLPVALVCAPGECGRRDDRAPEVVRGEEPVPARRSALRRWTAASRPSVGRRRAADSTRPAPVPAPPGPTGPYRRGAARGHSRLPGLAGAERPAGPPIEDGGAHLQGRRTYSRGERLTARAARSSTRTADHRREAPAGQRHRPRAVMRRRPAPTRSATGCSSKSRAPLRTRRSACRRATPSGWSCHTTSALSRRTDLSTPCRTVTAFHQADPASTAECSFIYFFINNLLAWRLPTATPRGEERLRRGSRRVGSDEADHPVRGRGSV